MRRLTEAQRIEQGNEEQATAFFASMLGALPDPRRRQGKRYPLGTVVVTALMAMVCGCDDAEAMQEWGEANAEWLATFLAMPHGPPTQDVFLSVFAALDPEAFGAVFRAWANLLVLRLKPQGKHIAVDGKTSRRGFDSTRLAPHTVSAWLSDAGLVLAQQKTKEKSNEITAIPELLRMLDLRRATITIDAMGCQTAIAKTIVDGGGAYLLAVKDNQPTLHQDIIATFSEAGNPGSQILGEAAQPTLNASETVDKEHGRLERRTINVCRDLRRLTTLTRWPGLAFVAEIVRERTDLTTSITSTETAYYIGSDITATPAITASHIRRHWSIENGLHWVLDVAFREDEARHRAGNAAQNLTALRHFALNIVKQDPHRRLGVANTRKRAGWDRNYLIRLLAGAMG